MAYDSYDLYRACTRRCVCSCACVRVHACMPVDVWIHACTYAHTRAARGRPVRRSTFLTSCATPTWQAQVVRGCGESKDISESCTGTCDHRATKTPRRPRKNGPAQNGPAKNRPAKNRPAKLDLPKRLTGCRVQCPGQWFRLG